MKKVADNCCSESTSSSCSGNYDSAIVAIAIGHDLDMDSTMVTDANSDHDGLDALMAEISAELDDADIDHDETWLRRCTGDLPNEVDTNSDSSRDRSPTTVQSKYALDQRDKERTALIENLQEYTFLVESLKHQLYESEDTRLDLEDELDERDREVGKIKRELEKMKEAHKRRINGIVRTREMINQKECFSSIMEHSSSDHSEITRTKRGFNESKTTGDQPSSTTPALLEGESTDETTKSKIAIYVEHKLQTDPKYREEFERFKAFQVYYQSITRNSQHQIGNDGSSGSKKHPKTDPSNTLPLGEEYENMFEFQLQYEQILSSTVKKSTNS